MPENTDRWPMKDWFGVRDQGSWDTMVCLPPVLPFLGTRSLDLIHERIESGGIPLIVASRLPSWCRNHLAWPHSPLTVLTGTTVGVSCGVWYEVSDSGGIHLLDWMAVDDRDLTPAAPFSREKVPLALSQESQCVRYQNLNYGMAEGNSMPARIVDFLRPERKVQIGGFPLTRRFLTLATCIRCCAKMPPFGAFPNLRSDGSSRWVEGAGKDRLLLWGCRACGALMTCLME
jgi:hypothetical protein